MADERNVNNVIAFDSLLNLIYKAEIPAGWVAKESKITYGTLKNLFSLIEQRSLKSTELVNALNLLCGEDLSKTLLKKPGNFIKKHSNFLKYNPDSLNKVVPDLDTDLTPPNKNSLGMFCDKLNINKEHIQAYLDDEHEQSSELPTIEFWTNGAVLELEKYCSAARYGWSTFVLLIFSLLGITSEDNQPSSATVLLIKSRVENLKLDKGKLLKGNKGKAGREDSIENLLCRPFDTALKRSKENSTAGDSVKDTEIKALQKQISKLIIANSQLESQLDLTCQSLKEESVMRLESDSQLKEISQSFDNLKKEKSSLSLKLTDTLSKLSSYSTRNINKKIKRQKEKSMNLQKSLNEEAEKNKILELEVSELNAQLTEALEKGTKLRKRTYYLEGFRKLPSKKSFSESYVVDLKDQIAFLENEKLLLEEKIESFMKKTISVYSKGCYNDNIRMVYEDLLCMGLSSRNIENVIKLSLASWQI